jgi:hypothetical protein
MNKFLLTVGTTVDQNGKEKINLSRWVQCKDKCYCWGIMISNGSES